MQLKTSMFCVIEASKFPLYAEFALRYKKIKTITCNLIFKLREAIKECIFGYCRNRLMVILSMDLMENHPC